MEMEIWILTGLHCPIYFFLNNGLSVRKPDLGMGATSLSTTGDIDGDGFMALRDGRLRHYKNGSVIYHSHSIGGDLWSTADLDADGDPT